MRSSIFAVLCAIALAGCAQASKEKSNAANAEPAKADASAQAGKADAAKSAGDMMTCARAKESRILKIVPVEPKGCKLLYPSESNSVASSSIGPGHCERVRSNIRTNLENAGFKCVEAAAEKVQTADAKK